MSKLRRGGARCFEDQDMLECVGQMVLAADNVADMQVRVVGTGRQVVGRHPIAAEQGEVLNVICSLALLAINRIGEAHLLAGCARYPKTQGKELTRGGAAITFFT